MVSGIPLMTVYPRGSDSIRTAKLTADGPEVPVPLFTYEQLERMTTQLLQTKATDLRDSLGKSASTLPPLPKFTQHDIIVNWLLDVQVLLARASGLDVTAEHFGRPNDADGVMGERTAIHHISRPAV